MTGILRMEMGVKVTVQTLSIIIIELEVMSIIWMLVQND